MFRRLPNKLPPDVTFPTDLQALGYFVTDKDQVRQIRDPEKKYQYKVNRNDRVNDVYKEAMNTCNRAIVRQRLLDLGLQGLLLPLGATFKDKHIPILVSPDLAEKKYILVVFTERHIDLGILSYRILGDEGINHGSIVNFVKTVLHGPSPPAGRPGLIITNPSELIWYRGGSRAVTDREWANLPRESAVLSTMRIDPVKNRVEGNANFEEHIQYIFEHILTTPSVEDIDKANSSTPICNPDAKFSIIGLEYPGSAALQYVVHNWPFWGHRISSIAFCNPQHSLRELFSQFSDTPQHAHVREQITRFIATRTRAYRVSRKPVEAPLVSINVADGNGLGCNVYSSGEALYEESVFVRCWASILDWIDLCRFSEGFEEPTFVIPDEEQGQSDEGKDKVKTKWPRTEDEIECARFQGEVKVIEDGIKEVDINNDGEPNGDEIEEEANRVERDKEN